MTFVQATQLDGLIVEAGLGYRRGKLQRYERASYSGIVVHTTGRGVHKKAKRWGVSHFQAALRVFTRQVNASGHYLIGQLGEVAQVVPEEVPAWHVGGRGSWRYSRAGWWRAEKVAWWRERWPQHVSPMELAGGRLWAPSPTTGRPSCNSNTIGIEVVPPIDNGVWSEKCWATLVVLCKDIAQRRGIMLSRETIVSHSDAHPFARSARGQPWDPAIWQWDFERFARLSRNMKQQAMGKLTLISILLKDEDGAMCKVEFMRPEKIQGLLDDTTGVGVFLRDCAGQQKGIDSYD